MKSGLDRQEEYMLMLGICAKMIERAMVDATSTKTTPGWHECSCKETRKDCAMRWLFSDSEDMEHEDGSLCIPFIVACDFTGQSSVKLRREVVGYRERGIRLNSGSGSLSAQRIKDAATTGKYTVSQLASMFGKDTKQVSGVLSKANIKPRKHVFNLGFLETSQAYKKIPDFHNKVGINPWVRYREKKK